MIGLIGAMRIETEEIIQAMSHAQEEAISGVTYVHGFIGGQEIVAATCGIGKVFAALCAQTMILKYKVSHIINLGVAGGLAPGLAVGDIVIADKVVQHDIDTSALGDPVGLISGINQVYLSCDPESAQRFGKIAEQLKYSASTGVIASGDQFIAKATAKIRLQREFGAVACEMEGGAIGQICFVNQVPFTLLRAISDGADNSAGTDYQTFAKTSAAHMQAMIMAYLTSRP